MKNREENRNTVIVPSFSLTTSRLSLYNTIVREETNTKTGEVKLSKVEKENLLKNIYGDNYASEKRFHNFKISDSARKKMLNKIGWLYTLAKSKKVKTISGKEIVNFKINFLTLTLPAKQAHSTAEITAVCFNQFLTELREKFELENYVWRLEFQKNQNVHYHIVTDCYIDFFICQKIWSRCVSKLGYIQRYHDKHAVMSLADYIREYSKDGQTTFETLAKRYAKGRQSNWSLPNCVDVKPVTSGKKIAFYVSKYFSKKEKSETDKNELDDIENSQGLRLWFCSRSLSKLDRITDFVPAYHTDLLSIVTSAKDCFEVVHEYCTSYYFSFSSVVNEYKGVLFKIFKDYSTEKNYRPHEGVLT